MSKKTAELRRERERCARETRVPLDFLAAGGQMGKLFRSFDWSKRNLSARRVAQ